MKLTQWYPSDIKPLRTGWYECKCCNLDYFWNGTSWDNTDIGGPSLKQDIEWRGLTKRSDDAREPAPTGCGAIFKAPEGWSCDCERAHPAPCKANASPTTKDQL